MERVLNLAGKNSSEIFQLRYPYSLLTFCDYDLSYFAENAIAVCDEALRSGTLDADRATDLRNSLKNMHVWIEHNLRTVYDKIVLDCWIDYVCRRDNIGTAALWNRFIDCKTTFEKSVFVRLCEYRYNKGINEWLNLVRVQDYAKSKVYFLFSREISGVEEANARRNYFDLMFSVTARELGCRLEDLGVTQVFSTGRVPSAPFMYPNISKDIIKNLLPDFDYNDDYSDIGSYECLSDQIAMDAFSHMKAGLAQELSSYNMSRSAMEHTPMRVYMPCGLKAVVDLEIDALIESGGWLTRCKRCGRYFVRDGEHTEEYCSLPVPNGKTCLELYEMEHPRSLVTPEAEKLCSEITDEMYGRVASGSMSLKEYESWKQYLEAMKGKVNNGEIPPEDLTAFVNYSRTMDITRSNPVSEVPKREPERSQGRVVKPFVPERISRSDLERKPEEPQPEPVEIPRPQPRREGFFTSPSVERQRQGKPPVSHIIRAGEPRDYQPQPAFVPEYPLGAQEPAFAPETREPARAEAPQWAYQQHNENVQSVPNVPSAPNAPGYTQSAPRQSREQGFTPFAEPPRSAEPEIHHIVRAAEPQSTSERYEEPKFVSFGGTEFGSDFDAPAAEPEITQEPRDAFEDFQPEPVPEWEEPVESAEPSEPQEEPSQPEPVPEPAPRPKVIKKNAAAISAYGKIAGTPLARADGYEAVSRPEPVEPLEPAKPSEPVDSPAKTESGEKDPFWEIGSIFDVLEQSENDMRRSSTMTALSEPDSSEPHGTAFERESVQPSEPAEPAERPAPAEKQAAKRTAHRKPLHQPEVTSAQADSGEMRRQAKKRSAPAEAPQPETKAPEAHAEPQEIPSGIWTEERHLFDPDDHGMTPHEELNLLKDKKRGRSSKTQRLFDAIMRESDDNPNFRKK